MYVWGMRTTVSSMPKQLTLPSCIAISSACLGDAHILMHGYVASFMHGQVLWLSEWLLGGLSTKVCKAI